MSDLKKLSDKIRIFCEERDWGQFHDPKNMAISLQIEAAEVLELFQWTQDNQLKKGKEEEISDELADVLYWTIKLADNFDIDLVEAFNKKMEQNEKKYPVDKAKGRSDKYNEL